MPGAARVTAPGVEWLAGIGCRRDCPHAELRALLNRALAQAGIGPSDLVALATIEHKCSEHGLQALAAELGLSLQAWPAERLRQFDDQLTTRSQRTFEQYGCHGIAEPAALAAAAADPAYHWTELALGRIGSDRATIALARRGPQPR